MNKIITILFALSIIAPVGYAAPSINADIPSVGERMRNTFKQQAEREGPLSEEEQEDLIICQEKIDRYTKKVNKYVGKTNLDDFQQWKFKYYTKRLSWWKKYCAE
jgi:hypothetical protein